MFIHIFYKSEFIRSLSLKNSIQQKNIGRNKDSDISLHYDEIVSSKHALLEIKKDQIKVIDLNSKNGTYIAGKKINKTTVPLETSIFIGNSKIILSSYPYEKVKKTVLVDAKLLKSITKEDKLFDSEKALKFLYNLEIKLSDIKNEADFLDTLFNALDRQYHADRITFFEINSNDKNPVLQKSLIRKQTYASSSFSSSVINEVITKQQAVFLNNLSNQTDNIKSSIKQIGINSIIVCPLIIKGTLVAILQLEFFENSTFTEQDFYTLCILSQLISSTYKNNKIINEIQRENNIYQQQLSHDTQIIGEHETTKKLKKNIKDVASTDTTVLITGESGTGKELVAKSIHYQSLRKNRPFIAINCASIPEHLIESEFFGHLKGAFTGALNKRIGKFETANHGTIFLDEIGDMNLNLQTKLLRFLELGEIQPIGSNKTSFVDVRIIAATNKELKQAVKENLFRKDLYYRLAVFNINCPRLSERHNDIIKLSKYFLQKYSLSMNKNIIEISKEAKKLLLTYSWPGNIRELKNTIERACVLGEGNTLLPEFLPPELFDTDSLNKNPQHPSSNSSISLEDLEKNYILQVLKDNNNNKAKAAEILGISRKTLYSKIT